MSSMSYKSKKPRKISQKRKKIGGGSCPPGKCTVLGGGKCPNLGVVNVRILGVVNVRILGVVNVRLANDLPPSKIVQIEQTIKKTRKTQLLQPSKDKNTKKRLFLIHSQIFPIGTWFRLVFIF